jgi:autotransporter-associated beta strand protein
MRAEKSARTVRLCAAAGVVGLLIGGPSGVRAANISTFAPASGSWADPANWTPNVVPNGVGDAAIFSNINTATRTVTVDSGAPGFTVGSISFDVPTGTAFTNSVTTGTTGSNLKFDNGGAGATITVTGTGTGNNTISVPLVFNETVAANVLSTSASSGAGALNLTAAVSGAGGFTKNGDGLATFGTGAKTYTGPTVLNGGRMRSSLVASPTATSSFTIKAGAQLDLISAGTYTFGSGPFNLNGSGATTGPFAAFPGAIRNDTNLAVTIANPVVLQSDSLIHVQGSATGSVTLTNTVSGPGKLTLTALNSDVNQGQLVLQAANTYSGGTLVAGGLLLLNTPSASTGTGPVTILDSGIPTARMAITTGVLNGIADTATLSLAGGRTAGTADQGYIDLGTGVNEVVAGLVLAGTSEPAGTYGSTASPALFKNDEFFSGLGVVTVLPVPEPGTLSILAMAGVGLLARRRRHA